jgi:hypothetical protein
MRENRPDLFLAQLIILGVSTLLVGLVAMILSGCDAPIPLEGGCAIDAACIEDFQEDYCVPTVCPKPGVCPEPNVCPEPVVCPEPIVCPEPTVCPEPEACPVCEDDDEDSDSDDNR